MNKRVYILGTRGIPANHSGFESFIGQLAPYLSQKGWDVTVYCQSNEATSAITEDEWRGVRRFHVSPYIKAFGKVICGPIGTGVFDWRSIWHAKTQPQGVFLTFGYNTGLFNLLPIIWGRKQMINMNGIEWIRAKWSWPYKLAFRINYWFSGMAGDRLIADHPEIHKILDLHFKKDKIRMIAYTAPAIKNAGMHDNERYELVSKRYVTMIARMEPENNILPIIQVWARKSRGVKLAILGRFDLQNAYHCQVQSYASDEIIFLGPVYETQVVEALRFHALAHVHGHTVGGTNPSLVEALGAGQPVIAHDNRFNRWVAGEAGVYFTSPDHLDRILDDLLNDADQLAVLSRNARLHYNNNFTPEVILGQYNTILQELLEEE